MPIHTWKFDIFQKDLQGVSVWMEAVSDIDTARTHLRRLTGVLPGEYFVFDQTTGHMVASMIRLGTDSVQ
jgi:hypothetical protein